MFGKKSELGRRFGKADLERIGLFAEMPHLSGKRKRKPKTEKGLKNFYGKGHKIKDGTQMAYFDPVFRRIFSKEAIKGRWKQSTRTKLAKVTTKAFYPPIGFKKHSTPGDHYGTFSGIIPAFSNIRKRKPAYHSEKKNFVAGPLKMGGPGYANICINRYPEHMPDRYGSKPIYRAFGKNIAGPIVTAHYPEAYFETNPYKDPAKMKRGPIYIRPVEKLQKIIAPGYIIPTGPPKLQGGCHAGCFDPFPKYRSDRHRKKTKTIHEPAWYPVTIVQKSYYNTSIVYQNVDFKLNATNYKTFQGKYSKYNSL